MKFLNFVLFLWVILALLDPDSEYGSGSTDLTESGSNMDPDPKHIFSTYLCFSRRASCMEDILAISAAWNLSRSSTTEMLGPSDTAEVSPCAPWSSSHHKYCGSATL
jgi:hypothetical protein